MLFKTFLAGRHWPGIHSGVTGLRRNRRSVQWGIWWSLHLHSYNFTVFSADLQLSWCTYQVWPRWTLVSFVGFKLYLLYERPPNLHLLVNCDLRAVYCIMCLEFFHEIFCCRGNHIVTGFLGNCSDFWKFFLNNLEESKDFIKEKGRVTPSD